MISTKRKVSCQDLTGWLLLVISVFMLAKSITLCFSNDIWYDELFTVGMIEHSYGELVAFTARDVHPPLYYCVTKFIVDLCKLINPAVSTVIAAKLVSVLPYFILLVYSVTFIRRRFSSFVAGVFLFCAVAMPQLSGYTVEIRMYSWALLFVTAALLHAYGTLTADAALPQRKRADNAEAKLLQQNRKAGIDEAETGQNSRKKFQYIHGAAFVFYGLAAAYTQYFACVAVVMIYLYVLTMFLFRDKKRVREWFLWAAVSVLGYVPWLYSLIRQMTAVNENYWILPLTWRSLGGCVKFLMKPSFTNDKLNMVLAVLLFIIYVFVFGCFTGKTLKHYYNGRVLKRQPGEEPGSSGCADELNAAGRLGFAIAGIGVLGGLVVFGFAASILLRPIFVYRYMIPAMGCFWLAFAVCLDGLQAFGAEWADGIKLAVTLLIAVIGLRNYRAFSGEEEYKTLLMLDTQKALASIEAEDIVVYNFDQVQAVTSYYMEDTVESYLWCGMPEVLIQDIIRSYDTVEETDAVVRLAQKGISENKNVWFIGSFNSRDAIVEEWRESGLTIEEQGSYLLERYWFNLYKISMEQ